MLLGLTPLARSADPRAPSACPALLSTGQNFTLSALLRKAGSRAWIRKCRQRCLRQPINQDCEWSLLPFWPLQDPWESSDCFDLLYSREQVKCPKRRWVHAPPLILNVLRRTKDIHDVNTFPSFTTIILLNISEWLHVRINYRLIYVKENLPNLVISNESVSSQKCLRGSI